MFSLMSIWYVVWCQSTKLTCDWYQFDIPAPTGCWKQWHTDLVDNDIMTVNESYLGVGIKNRRCKWFIKMQKNFRQPPCECGKIWLAPSISWKCWYIFWLDPWLCPKNLTGHRRHSSKIEREARNRLMLIETKC